MLKALKSVKYFCSIDTLLSGFFARPVLAESVKFLLLSLTVLEIEINAIATESANDTAIATESANDTAIATESTTAIATESANDTAIATESANDTAIATESTTVIATESTTAIATESANDTAIATESATSTKAPKTETEFNRALSKYQKLWYLGQISYPEIDSLKGISEINAAISSVSSFMAAYKAVVNHAVPEKDPNKVASTTFAIAKSDLAHPKKQQAFLLKQNTSVLDAFLTKCRINGIKYNQNEPAIGATAYEKKKYLANTILSNNLFDLFLDYQKIEETTDQLNPISTTAIAVEKPTTMGSNPLSQNMMVVSVGFDGAKVIESPQPNLEILSVNGIKIGGTIEIKKP